MAECLIMKGGGGGVTSSDVTADKSKVLAGYLTVTTDSGDSPVEGTMPNNGAVTPAKLSPGATYTIPEGYHDGTGVVAAKSKNVAMISAEAYRGFGMNQSDYDLAETNQFTIPAGATNCVVHYGGISADRGGAGEGLCRITCNGTVKDDRDLTGNSFTVRGTMINKQFEAAAGDVIAVECTASSGTDVLSFIYAVIEYFT